MTQWKLSGTYFETCNCEAACPCVFTSPPTEGECKALVAWHIDKGSYAGTALDGLNVALAVHAPGTMVATKWQVAAYFDDKASAAQNDALHAIFGGKAGGHPAVLASFIGEMVGAKNVPMRYEANGRKSSLSIPGVAEAQIESLAGPGRQSDHDRRPPAVHCPRPAGDRGALEPLRLCRPWLGVEVLGPQWLHVALRLPIRVKDKMRMPVILNTAAGPRHAPVWIAMAAIAGASWLYLGRMDASMSAMNGGASAHAGMAMGGGGADALLAAFVMWAAMMVAMMLPTVAPSAAVFAKLAARRDPSARQSRQRDVRHGLHRMLGRVRDARRAHRNGGSRTPCCSTRWRAARARC